MIITKDTAVETVKRWIESSVTSEQLECCDLFIQDTLYMRFGADQEVLELRLLVNTKKETLGGK